MPTLSKELRGDLARVTLDARAVAEGACRAALENLAVHEKDYRGHMTAAQRLLRNQLRARGRALGDTRDERSGAQEIRHLAEAAAYEQWHRLLFTRFLTENTLLHTDESQGHVPVTLQDCEELAPELGARDGFDLACRFASRTLPGVFRFDDPALTLRLALNDEVELRKILDSLPQEVFTATDSLGWTYQFWQEKRKEEINRSNKERGADEIPAVTQLFTEDYMVDFLLDNTLGAWHAGKALATNPKLAENAKSEEELREAVALPGCPCKYLRFIKGKDGRWTPAAGTFDGWPKTAKELKCLDPCMGSGHFVVAMFERLVALRMVEENLDEAAAVEGVIHNNLFGLEIDPRCTQIGAFNLALAAWRRVGYRPLPAMNLACSGLAPYTREADWLVIAGDDGNLQNGMARLYRLFKNAPVLGSLINPRAAGDELLEAAFHKLQPLLEKALAQETEDDTAHEMAVTARGLAKAAEILAGHFTLVATNVPYLGRENHSEILVDFAQRYAPDASADLSTLMLNCCQHFAGLGGTISVVLPQNWWVGKSYSSFRKRLLAETSWRFAVVLGEEAWQTFGNRGPSTILLIVEGRKMSDVNRFATIDVSTKPGNRVVGLDTKARALAGERESEELQRLSSVVYVAQNQLCTTKEARISVAQLGSAVPLSSYVKSGEGCSTGDNDHFLRRFWELSQFSDWLRYSGPGFEQWTFCDTSLVVLWEDGKGELAKSDQARIQNTELWTRSGVLVGRVRGITATLFSEGCFSKGAVLVCPNDATDFLPTFTFLRSKEFENVVRTIDPRVSAATSVLTDVPFDLAHWQMVAAKKYPHGLPKPFSSDPTQWLFNGQPNGSEQPLHVAVARLLGYQWPRQTGSDFPGCPALSPDGLEKLADEDGIVCLPPLNREQPAAHRMWKMLAKALGKFDERALLANAGPKGSKSTTLEDWLRDEFFEQHCDLFHQRPFIWHIWDGRKDGFHALVNYHKLDQTVLQKLTYSYLGDWIRHQEEDAKAEKPGADARLGAARALQTELAKILEGEAPHDIFVRWKPLAKQALGWRPDINDGVRLNIRPFMTATDVGKKGAGILRSKPGVKWDKDRGKEPQSDKAEYPWFWCDEEPGADPLPSKKYPDKDNRWNNVHLRLKTKREARK